MKFTSAAVILFFVGSACIFQLCYSLLCHCCQSANNEDPECGVISDDRYLKECKPEQKCGEIFYIMEHAPSQVFRLCMTTELLDAMKPNISLLTKAGIKVGISLCGRDRCNKKFQVPDDDIKKPTIH